MFLVRPIHRVHLVANPNNLARPKRVTIWWANDPPVKETAAPPFQNKPKICISIPVAEHCGTPVSGKLAIHNTLSPPTRRNWRGLSDGPTKYCPDHLATRCKSYPHQVVLVNENEWNTDFEKVILWCTACKVGTHLGNQNFCAQVVR